MGAIQTRDMVSCSPEPLPVHVDGLPATGLPQHAGVLLTAETAIIPFLFLHAVGAHEGRIPL